MTKLTESIQSIGLCSRCGEQMVNSITFLEAEKARELVKQYVVAAVSQEKCLNETQRLTVMKTIQGVI